MPIPLANLDDHKYADLVQEALASIPQLHPRWTNHNPSDPGIAFTELLAWLTEMILFRVNRVPEPSYRVFLKILNGKNWVMPAGQDMEQAIRSTLLLLRERYRAITPGDFEYLVKYTWPGTPDAQALGQKIRR